MAGRRQRVFIPFENDKKKPGWVGIIIWLCIFWPVGVVKGIQRVAWEARDQRRRRMMHIANAIDDRDIIPINEISARVGRSRQTVIEDIQRMIERGYMPAGTYIDHGRGVLVFGDAVGGYATGDRPYEDLTDAVGEVVGSVVSGVVTGVRTGLDAAQENYRAMQKKKGNVDLRKQVEPEPRKAPGPQPRPAEQPAADDYEGTLKRIRELNARIADPAVSRRIDRIEELAASIFNVLRQHPERKEDVHKFMSYYLPVTLKLLNTYALMEKQSYQGDNISQSRRKIEGMLDTLVQAFEKMQDELFRTEAMDVDADISVLETMLRKDGLVSMPGVDLHKAAGGH